MMSFETFQKRFYVFYVTFIVVLNNCVFEWKIKCSGSCTSFKMELMYIVFIEYPFTFYLLSCTVGARLYGVH